MLPLTIVTLVVLACASLVTPTPSNEYVKPLLFNPQLPTDTDRLHIAVAGGGPAGLAFAFQVLKAFQLMGQDGKRIHVHVYEGRWYKEPETGVIAWRGPQQNNHRRPQVGIGDVEQWF